MKRWKNIPDGMKCNEVFQVWYRLRRRNFSLLCKRVFDVVTALLLILLLSPVFLVLAIVIKADSAGPVFFRQTRVTQYGKTFCIFKFRTMVVDAEQRGTQVTQKDDSRITKVGGLIRKCRLDEIPQLFNILAGTMTFVGTRPEVPKYVACYTDEMKATLLLPAGVTSEASIKYKDEDCLLDNAENADQTYVTVVLPAKMEYNLQAIRKQSFWRDLGTMFKTVFAVLKR